MVVGRLAWWGRTNSYTFGPDNVRLIEDAIGTGHTTTYPDGFNITLQITPESTMA